MRKRVLLLLLIALLLPGCGPKAPTDEGPLTLNPDGTLGNLRWGMRYAEAVKADSRIRLGVNAGPGTDSCTVEFLGKTWTLNLTFGAPGVLSPYAQDDVSRLGQIELIPPEGESWEELVEPLEAALGPRNIRVRYQAPLPEWAWAWQSAETLGDRLTERELAAAYPYADDLSSLRDGTPLFTAYFLYREPGGEYWYGNADPPEEPTGELRLVIEGSYAVEACILEQLLGPWDAEPPTLSPGADLSAARLYYRGEEYLFTGETVYALPGTHPYEMAVLLGAVKPSGSREELTGNLDGFVYMQRGLLFPLYFRWREWDGAEGPEPWLKFSIRKGG
jgi:hypothetical protein